MALKPYDSCPGGTGNKIKFCGCGKDILEELNDMFDSMAGGQRAAALSQADRLLRTKGNRPCLLAMKGISQYTLDAMEPLSETVKVFLDEHPENPIALALSAILAARSQDYRQAVDQLQRSLNSVEEEIYEAILFALPEVANALLQAGRLTAARSLLSIHATLLNDKRNASIQTLIALQASPDIPMLLKLAPPLASPSEGAAYSKECAEALHLANGGKWQIALDRFKALAEKYPDEPAIVRNVAILLARLAYDEESADWWRRYARMDGVPLSEAVLAEAFGLLSAGAELESVALVSQTYPITDADTVMERLTDSNLIERLDVDLSRLGDEDTPPPRAAFMLLDRPVQETAEGVTFDQIPQVIGEILLYGKETDQGARLAFAITKTAEEEEKTAVLREVLGNLMGEMSGEEIQQMLPASSVGQDWRWRLPNETTHSQRIALIEAKRRDVNLNVWPNTPSPLLDGKTPAEAAEDPSLRIRLMAMILQRELAFDRECSRFDGNELRAKLGLPIQEDLEVAEDTDIRAVSILDLHRLPAEKLSDLQLHRAFDRAQMNRATRAIRRLAEEMLNRDRLLAMEDRAKLYDILSDVAYDIEEALEFNRKAQETAVSAGSSPARFMFSEIQMRLTRGELDRAGELINILRTRHIEEPGVAETLYRLLVQLGIINPDGSPAQLGAQQQAPTQDPRIVVGDQPTRGPAGGLLTPDQPPPSDKPKPNLWVPD